MVAITLIQSEGAGARGSVMLLRVEKPNLPGAKEDGVARAARCARKSATLSIHVRQKNASFLLSSQGTPTGTVVRKLT